MTPQWDTMEKNTHTNAVVDHTLRLEGSWVMITLNSRGWE